MMVSAPDGGQVTLSVPNTVLEMIGEDQTQQTQQSQNGSKFKLLIDGEPTRFNEQSILPSNINLQKETNREISFYVSPNSRSIQIIGMD